MANSSTSFDSLYARLNAGQKLAVDTIEGPVMVMAGPGTGKTQVLAMRIANILRLTQMDPWNILCLTFTESGVAAMRQRLLSIIGTPAYYVKIHTFHSFCNEIMQDAPELFMWTRGVTVVSDIERIMMLREIVDGLSARSPLKPFGNPYLYFGDIAKDIQDLKREDISPTDFAATLGVLGKFVAAMQEQVNAWLALKPKERTAGSCAEIHSQLLTGAKTAQLPENFAGIIGHMWSVYESAEKDADGERELGKARTQYKNAVKKWFTKMADNLPKQLEIARVYEEYQAKMRKEGRYDYEDMIMKVVAELKVNDALLQKYQEQFQYILVDEYQDTNGAQNEVVEVLGSFDEAPNIFVVGDDKQSIYRFQGASLANMLYFYEKYKDSIKVVSLKENYRSQQTILDAATGVIGHNAESIARHVPGVTQELLAVTGRETVPIAVQVLTTEDAEDYWVATKAQSLIASGVRPSEIAVLYRTNKDGQSLLKLMRRLGVPARLEIGENALDDHGVKQWLNLLIWLTDGKDDEPLAHIMQYAWWHLPAVDTLKVIHYAGSKYRSLFHVLSTPKELELAGVEKPELFLEFAGKLALWRQEAVTLPLQLLLEKLVVESHWLDHVMEDDGQAMALRKMTAVLNEAKQLNAAHHHFKLQDFVRHVRLLREHEVKLEVPAWQGSSEAVRLMTAHKAKGLEFEQVFVMRLNDKHWGNTREMNKAPLPAGLVKHDVTAGGEANEDERRLFYVALTRAKQQVYLTRAALSGSGRETVPAIFLEELPVRTVEQVEVAETGAEELGRLRATLLQPIKHTHEDEIKEYVLSLLDGYVMSVTHLNNYLECPRRFYFRNLLRIPTAKSKSLALGSAAHEALYDLFLTINEKGTVLPKAEFVGAFRKALEREILAPEQKADALEKGEHMLGVYYDRYKKEFHDHSLLEYDFGSHGVRVGDLALTGKIDKIEILDPTSSDSAGRSAKRKTVNVIDYKTGNVENGLKKLKVGGDYWRQLVFYQLLCDESPRFDYEMVSGEVDFIEPSDTKGFMKKKVEVSKEAVSELKETIKKVWAEMHELKFLREDGGCGKDDCEYCGVH